MVTDYYLWKWTQYIISQRLLSPNYFVCCQVSLCKCHYLSSLCWLSPLWVIWSLPHCVWRVTEWGVTRLPALPPPNRNLHLVTIKQWSIYQCFISMILPQECVLCADWSPTRLWRWLNSFFSRMKRRYSFICPCRPIRGQMRVVWPMRGQISASLEHLWPRKLVTLYTVPWATPTHVPRPDSNQHGGTCQVWYLVPSHT